jgi:hypothetical protein
VSKPKTSVPSDYAVGYGSPPKETRFPPRAKAAIQTDAGKASRSVGAVLKDIIEQKIAVTENGKTRRMPALEVMLRRLVNDAIRGDGKDPTPRPAKAGLSAQESAMLRVQLIADLNRLQSSDEAADWVHKNTLTAADANSGVARFRERSQPSTPHLPVSLKSRRPWRKNPILRLKNLSPPRSPTPPELRSPTPVPPARAVAAFRRRPFACATRSTANM